MQASIELVQGSVMIARASRGAGVASGRLGPFLFRLGGEVCEFQW